MMKRIVYTYILLLAVFTAGSQEKKANSVVDKTDSIISIMQKVKQQYADQSFLRFAIRYTYASAANAEQIKDSVTGWAQIHQSNYSVRLSNTESIQTDNRLVTLYDDEKLMYISAGRGDAGKNIPIHTIADTTLLHQQGISSHIYDSSHYTNICLTMPEESVSRSILFCIDKQNGFFVYARYLLKTEALLSNEEIEQNLRAKIKTDPYSIVQVSFYDYDTSPFDTNIFSEANYFTTKDDTLLVTDRYAAYQLFNANVKAR